MRTEMFAQLRGDSGTLTELAFCEGHQALPEAVDSGEIDAVIVGCETGFSEFGLYNEFLAKEVGVSYQFMRDQAEWNRYQNERVSLLSFAGSGDSGLRSLVLLPYGGSQPGRGCLSYRPFESDLPSRDFYYNVAFEAFRIACEHRQARRIWMMNPAAPWSFHRDIATCVCEALAHWCDATPEHAPTSVIFNVVGESGDERAEGMRKRDFSGVRALNAEGGSTRHRPISRQSESVSDEQGNRVELTHLDWWS